ncbi:aminotransferase class I/II-fold pyridoxal phosphate-dependent enzyme [Mucilaginibacter sp. P25]|uniref:aminotransferase class I/II-fold pyridoxal phosphate-dependent enzyme n=1 Tax=Mucilaginibacter sp. P25 TaxID=3423945 RepID=UPI003D7A1042
MEKILDFQDFNLYSVDDHRTWATLCNRHRQLHAGKLAKEYLSGLDKLQLDHESIVDIAEVSNKLKSISGWTLVPVTGLLSTKDFFLLLAKKTYPITVYIRKPSEMDFSEQPDIFHDVFGHLPLLTDEKFTKFLTAYSIIALKYINNEKAIDILGRLYWFTYEMGLIREDGECKPYGGAVITSVEEILNVSNEKVPKHSFDVDHIFKSLFDSFKIQLEYFVIDSFDDLFSSLATLEQKLIGNLLIPDDDFSLRNYSVNIHLGRGFNDVIGFLNGIQFQFPNALSFVAGQPDETFFEVDDHISKYNLFVNYLAEKTGQDKKTVINGIGQYNKTKGIINEIISDYLKNDENITIKPENTIITAGAQEAFSIIVSAICNREDDVILMENPSYIGVSSFAKIFDYKIGGISCDEEGINLEELKNKVIAVNNSGKRVKLVYVIPDYQNPSGSCMPIGNRLKLLELAYKYNFLIIEDSVYNSFTYAQKKIRR